MTAIRKGFSRRTSPAFAVGGLGFEPNPRRPGEGWNFAPLAGWRCYHCGENFTSFRTAAAHFGRNSDVPPLCLRVADLCGDIRVATARSALRELVFRVIWSGSTEEYRAAWDKACAVMDVLEYGLEPAAALEESGDV